MTNLAHADVPAGSLARPCTLGGWLARAEQLYAQHEVALGQVATSAHDEALYLLLRTLGLPLDSDTAVLARQLNASERTAVEKVLRRRLVDRVPAAYLTREAFLGEYRFYVDERVIIPRSYFLEIISQVDRWLKKATTVTRAADVCTGSGCLAILLAHRFPAAHVDAIDLSAAALAVAKINVHEHGLADRVLLHRSNVFNRIPPVRYEVIVCNPPYEPSSLMKTLSPEFQKEPRLALDGGPFGSVELARQHSGFTVERQAERPQQEIERLVVRGSGHLTEGGRVLRVELFRARQPAAKRGGPCEGAGGNISGSALLWHADLVSPAGFLHQAPDDIIVHE